MSVGASVEPGAGLELAFNADIPQVHAPDDPRALFCQLLAPDVDFALPRIGSSPRRPTTPRDGTGSGPPQQVQALQDEVAAPGLPVCLTPRRVPDPRRESTSTKQVVEQHARVRPQHVAVRAQ